MPTAPLQSGDSTARDRSLILLAAFVAVLPLLLRGPSCGHDLNFHMTNWMEAAEQWRHGIFWPRWAFTPAWGAGEPRFVFYPPLSWLLGGVLTLLMPLRFVPAAFTYIALAASGLTMRRLAAEWTASRCALLAAVFYIANPYMLFCAYERCAYGELLAAAWMPLLLLAVLRRSISLRSIAIPVALLWLTNAPLAVLGCYLFAIIATLRLLLLSRNAYRGRRIDTMLPFALRCGGGITLGLGLAAFYIVPAAWERRWVHIEIAIRPPMDVASNTLFRHTIDAAHDAVLGTASWLALLMLAITAVLLCIAWKQHGRSNRVLLGLLSTSILCIALALTPVSLFAWHHLPQLTFVQFPWRIISLLGVLCSLLLALASRPRRRTLLAASILLPMALVPPLYRQFHILCFDDDMPSMQATNFHSGNGSEPIEEYIPHTATVKPLNAPSDTVSVYPWWLSTDPQSISPRPAAQSGSIDFSTLQNLHIPAQTGAPHFLILRLRNYPAWQVRVNGVDAPILPRADGYIALALPNAQAADITIRYRTLLDEIIGLVISLLALLIFLLLRRRTRIRAMNTLPIPIPSSSPFMPAVLPT